MIIPLLFLPSISKATGIFDKFWVTLDEFNIEYLKSVSTNRTPLLPDHRQKAGELSTNFNFRVMKTVYSRNRIESYIAQNQFSYVGLISEVGISNDTMELFVKHYSGHCLDCIYNMKYPNENSIGIRLKLYQR